MSLDLRNRYNLCKSLCTNGKIYVNVFISYTDNEGTLKPKENITSDTGANRWVHSIVVFFHGLLFNNVEYDVEYQIASSRYIQLERYGLSPNVT